MMPDWLDRPTVVRPGEELDLSRLEAYLTRNIANLEGSLTVQQFPMGFSNLTYLLRVGETELVLRRPPFGAKIKSAHDMGREYTILSHLFPVYSKVPEPLHYCQDESVLGAPFYIMKRVQGVILRPHMPVDKIPPPGLMAQIADSCINNLVALHAVDFQSAGLGDLGRPAGYVRRQITGWTRRYQNAKTDEIPELEEVVVWLHDNIPEESGAALIHNDYKYDNLLLDPADWSTVIGVLDWEMATIGDPLMDLGSTLGYWVEANDPEEIQALRLSPTNLPGNPKREQLVQRYVERSGRDVPDILYYYIYGLFKLAGIVQQIYYRYRRGYTTDERFAELIHAVRGCGQVAIRAIARGRMN